MSRTERASACPTKPWRSRERRSENRPALQRRYAKTKRDPPVPESRGEAARKLLFSTKNREAWSLFSAKLVVDHLQAQRLTPISANLRSAALTNALRCRRTVSVGVFKRPKRGRFAYFSSRLSSELRIPRGGIWLGRGSEMRRFGSG